MRIWGEPFLSYRILPYSADLSYTISLHDSDNVATAGGCLALQYLVTWIMLRAGSREHAETALQLVTPVGQQADYIVRAIGVVEPYLPPTAIAPAA